MGYDELRAADKSSAPPGLTIDQAVDKIYNGFSIKIFLVFVTAVASVYCTAAETYITIFTGFIPYNQWSCVSER